MALIIVTSTGDSQISWNVLSLSFSERERESREWPLGPSDLHHNYLISTDCIQHSRKIFIATPIIKTIFLNSNLTLFVRFFD